ncbi:MAG: hypothetical protein ABJ000_14510 [Saccharospirillum sp.]|uniref:hypothetical protein n=1 Tax=Saccharospirillum sp. TaxID=2033801 RepID=UPI003296F1BA
MPDEKSVEHEIATLKWIVEIHESQGATKSCGFCRMVWLGVLVASTAFVVVSYNYHFVQVGFLLFGAAIAGGAFMAVGLFSQSTASLGIMSRYVDIESVKKRLNELQA